jgi:hypothetical protein
MPADRTAYISATAPGTLLDAFSLDPDEAALYRNRGIRSLSEHVYILSDLATESLRASEPAYRSKVSSLDRKMVKSATQVLAAWRNLPEELTTALAWPREIGHRRAEQGVPLDAVIRAYRIGGQVLFGAFVQWASEEDLPHDHSIALASDVWHVMDLHCTAAVTAFHETEEEMSSDLAVRAGRLLDALLDGNTSPDLVTDVAQACGLAERGHYVVVFRRPAASGAPLDNVDLPPKVAGIRVTWRIHGESAVGVAAVGNGTARMIAAELLARPGRRTGVSLVVDSLADLGRARRLAELAARTVTANDGVACLEDRLPAALLAARPDLAVELSSRVLGPVLALEQVSRDLLLDTLRVWMDAGGSASEAAVSLFCHRNTVINRIRRIERLTGRSVSKPEDLVELWLALQAYQLHAGRLREPV